MTIDTSENLIFLLRLSLTRGIGPRSVMKVLQKMSVGDVSSEVTAYTAARVAQEFSISLDVAEKIEDNSHAALELFDQLTGKDIKILSYASADYPTVLKVRLKDQAPPLLFVRGNTKLLHKLSVGFCGSRHASDKGLKVAAMSAELLAQKGFNVTSGYAQGVDMAAHKSALESNGSTVFVLAEGILGFKQKAELAGMMDPERFLVISEFMPNAKWEARNAMQRNNTICGLANAMVLIESGLTGGTFAAGEDALRLKVPLFVVEYAEPPSSADGNAYFIKKGAIPLRNGRASLGMLVDSLSAPPLQTPNSMQLQFGL